MLATSPRVPRYARTGWQSRTYATASLLIIARANGTSSLRTSEIDSEWLVRTVDDLSEGTFGWIKTRKLVAGTCKLPRSNKHHPSQSSRVGLIPFDHASAPLLVELRRQRNRTRSPRSHLHRTERPEPRCRASRRVATPEVRIPTRYLSTSATFCVRARYAVIGFILSLAASFGESFTGARPDRRRPTDHLGPGFRA